MATLTLDYPDLLSQKRPSVIHNKTEHKHWLTELEHHLQKPSLTAAEQKYCELLAVLVEDFEKKHYALKGVSDPIEILKELMAANDLQQKDLLDVFKHKSEISAVLKRKRGLTIEQIRGLAHRFRLSPEVFI
jgi:HTH-type transcriptional regulator / antitoxin HigA